MTTRHLVDPELLALAVNFPPFLLSNASLPAIRASIPVMLAAIPFSTCPSHDRDLHPIWRPGAYDPLPVDPPARPAANVPAILRFHGDVTPVFSSIWS